MEEVIIYLLKGWKGFARILVQQTNAGIIIKPERVQELEDLTQTINQVIMIQKARNAAKQVE